MASFEVRQLSETETPATNFIAIYGIMLGDRNMVVGPANRVRQPIAVRKAERELFFWTARQTLKLVVLVALTAYLIVSLVEGRLPGGELLVRYL